MARDKDRDPWAEGRAEDRAEDQAREARNNRKIRRLIIRDANGEQILSDEYGHPLMHYEIDLTAVANANHTAPIKVIVQEQCNLGCFHDKASSILPFWGAD